MSDFDEKDYGDDEFQKYLKENNLEQDEKNEDVAMEDIILYAIREKMNAVNRSHWLAIKTLESTQVNTTPEVNSKAQSLIITLLEETKSTLQKYDAVIEDLILMDDPDSTGEGDGTE